MLKIALIGRPNVGKSTLFNRLARKKIAIVNDAPGVTRDRKFAKVDLCGLMFDIIDTPGVDPISKNDLSQGMNRQSFEAVNESDIILFVIDSIQGITPHDVEIANWIRLAFKEIKSNKTVILVKNKSDGSIAPGNIYESLGFGGGIFVSAEHNSGIDEIYEKLAPLVEPLGSQIDENDGNNERCSSIAPLTYENDIPMKIAIVGRPNVGKSTLINAIIGNEKRLLTGEMAGVTRDAIIIDWKFKNRNIQIIDTAGQRRRSKVEEKVESLSVADAWRYVKQANIVVVVMDIQNPFENQDLTIARKAHDEGKIIIFALNKSDTSDEPEKIAKEIQRRAQKEFAQLPNVPCLLVSAKNKLGLMRIFNVATELFDIWSQRISTGQLNKWFESVLANNPPPLVNGMPIKLKYISQTSTKPPTFAVFANRAEHLPASYERYLLNNLRDFFHFQSVPLRIFIRQRANPYKK